MLPSWDCSWIRTRLRPGSVVTGSLLRTIARFGSSTVADWLAGAGVGVPASR